MKPLTYDRAAALRLLPLLDSIGREIGERGEALRRISEELGLLERRGKASSPQARCLIAEAADHKRELRHANTEIARLGCTLLGLHPPTIRIPGAGECKGYSWLWQVGLTVPHESWRDALEPAGRAAQTA